MWSNRLIEFETQQPSSTFRVFFLVLFFLFVFSYIFFFLFWTHSIKPNAALLKKIALDGFDLVSRIIVGMLRDYWSCFPRNLSSKSILKLCNCFPYSVFFPLRKRLRNQTCSSALILVIHIFGGGPTLWQMIQRGFQIVWGNSASKLTDSEFLPKTLARNSASDFFPNLWCRFRLMKALWDWSINSMCSALPQSHASQTCKDCLKRSSKRTFSRLLIGWQGGLSLEWDKERER